MQYNFKGIITELYSNFSRFNSKIPFNHVAGIDSRVALYLNEIEYQRPVKDQADVLREYELEKWGALLDRLSTSSDFSHKNCMLQFYGQQTIPMFFGDSVFDVGVLEYHKIATLLLSNFIEELACESPVELLELGCGFGGTLMGVALKLNHKLKLSKVTGIDISSAGLQILNKMSASENIPISMFLHDFGKDTPIPKMEICKSNTGIVFTNFSLAALTHYLHNPISNILLNSDAKFIIIFEPMFSDNKYFTFSSIFTNMHILRNSYNSELRNYINTAVDDGLCKVLFFQDHVIGASLASTISVYILESNI
jgi:hypothetical protein